MTTLKPASLIQIHETSPDNWEVRQSFYKLGVKIELVEHGYSRKMALEWFRLEKGYAEQDSGVNSLSALCGVIYDLSGWIDTVLFGFRSR